MNTASDSPLLRWEGAHLVLDLPGLAVWLGGLLPRDHVRDLTLIGEGEAVRLEMTAQWVGVGTRVALEVTELRLRHGLLGGRIRRVSVLGGMPLPRGALEELLERLKVSRLRVFSGQGIIVADLRDLVPKTLDLGVVALQGTERELHLWLGAGSFRLRQPPPEPLSS